MTGACCVVLDVAKAAHSAYKRGRKPRSCRYRLVQAGQEQACAGGTLVLRQRQAVLYTPDRPSWRVQIATDAAPGHQLTLDAVHIRYTRQPSPSVVCHHNHAVSVKWTEPSPANAIRRALRALRRRERRCESCRGHR
jgi:hypothetical protein